MMSSIGELGAGDPNADPKPSDLAETARVVVTTSTLEDWLWRGEDPIVGDMSWQVYAMWIYRVERPPPEDQVCAVGPPALR